MGKKAIVVVSFGTTVPETREKTIERFENLVREKYPEYDVFRAFTSRIVIQRIWEEEGVKNSTERGIMYRLAAEGYEEVILQPLHLIPGAEYDKLHALAAHWQAEKVFKRLVVGRPLLHFIGQEGERPDDYGMLVEALMKNISLSDSEALLLIGHGTFHTSQAVYSALQMKFLVAGYRNVFVGTIEGFPEWDEVARHIHAQGFQSVRLKPLFFVAGDHVQNDIFGDEEDAVAPLLKQMNMQIHEDHTALGEMEEIHALYLQHLQDAIDHKYMHRPQHRPAIPNIV